MREQEGLSPNLKITQPLPGEHSGPWTEAELGELEQFLHCRSTQELVEKFPARSRGAVTKRLSELRRERGLHAPHATKPSQTTGPAMLNKEDPGMEAPREARTWEQRAIESNAAFLAAIMRAGQAKAA